MANAELPIFPLHSVLFPDSLLRLRVFEARYVDMVRDCMRNNTEFGVCRIERGKEVGAPADPATIGCRTRIVDWNMEQLGVLQITALGTTRFEINSMRATPAGLILAGVTDLNDEPPCAVPEEWAGVTDLLQQILERVDADRERAGMTNVELIAKPYRYDDARWVSNRLGELLPIDLALRQELMETTDTLWRLERIYKKLVELDVL